MTWIDSLGRRPGGPARGAGLPATSTRPAAIASTACRRLPSRPRRTSSVSRRRRTVTGAGYAAGRSVRAAMSAGASSPRSAATYGGGGCGDRLTAGRRHRRGDPGEHERERPAERGGERAVGRRPVAHHRPRASPRRSLDERDRRRLGLARDLGAWPATRSRPRRRARRRPGSTRPASGTWRRGSWRRSAPLRAPRATRARARRSRSRGGSPTTTAVGRRLAHRVEPDVGERLDARPGPRTRARARRRGATCRAAAPPATALVNTSSGVGGDARMRRAWPPRRRPSMLELFGQERHPQPGGAERATPSAARGDRVVAAPDDAVEVAGRRPAGSLRTGRHVGSARRRARARRGSRRCRAHRHRELEVPAGAESVAAGAAGTARDRSARSR